MRWLKCVLWCWVHGHNDTLRSKYGEQRIYIECALCGADLGTLEA